MIVLTANLLIVFAFAYIARRAGELRAGGSNAAAARPDVLMAAFAAMSLVLVSGLRNTIGDTYFYMHAYAMNDIDWPYVLANKDIGFGILQMLLQQVTHNPQALLIVTAAVTNLTIAFVLYKYSKLYDISLFVFIASGMFLVSMNGVRQYLAAAIVFAATPYLIKGQWLKYIAVAVLASLFHMTAVIMIPIYFIARLPAWSRATMLMFAGVLIILVGFNPFLSLLFRMLEGSQYGVYQNFDGEGANVIRVLVYAAPVLIAFIGRKTLRETYPDSHIIVNMTVIGLMFMAISTQNWIFARFSIYFSLYQLILISWMIFLVVRHQRRLMYYGILVCYTLYFFYEHVISLQIQYGSDYLPWH